MSDTETEVVYARIENDQIAEYPVYAVHIQTRAHPVGWYTPVTFDPKPEITEFQYLVEVPVMDKLTKGVNVTYRTEDYTLEALMLRLPRDPNAPVTPGMPEEDNPPPTEALTKRIQQLTIQRIQQRLDTFAAQRGYGDDKTSPIVSACSYSGSSHAKYGPEGRYCLQAREDTWDALYKFMGEIALGQRAFPNNYETIEATLPELVWPT